MTVDDEPTLSDELIGWADITRHDVLPEIVNVLDNVRPKMRVLYATLPGVDDGTTSIEDENAWHAKNPGYRAMTNVIGDILALVQPVMYSSSLEPNEEA